MNDTILTVSDGTQMGAYVARPASSAAHGIIVLQEAFGVNDYIRRMTDRFAAQGYLAIAPELFHRTAPGFEADYETREAAGPEGSRGSVAEAMGALTAEGQIADAQAAYDWLLAELNPDGHLVSIKVVAIGFCMGGRAAYLANSALPLAASVSFYGGGIATLLDRAAALHGPQLLVWGGADAHIPPEQTRAIADALAVAGKPYVEATWSEAGHGFACDARSSYHAPSAHQALALADAFFVENLV
ncbi:MAG TPA: dienelactone hydrolase family protein [Candidatus Paceibacterota bacterium]